MNVVRLTAWLLRVCGGILAITGLLKLISLFGHAGILEQEDPVLGINLRLVLLFVGILEVCIAASLWRLRNRAVALSLVMWTGFCFLLYHLFRTTFGDGQACPCLGTVFGWLGLNPRLLDTSLVVVSVFMLLGGGMLLWRSWNLTTTPTGTI